MPKIAEMEVEECPVPKQSYLLSEIFGNPLNPLNLRIVGNSSFLPVKTL